MRAYVKNHNLGLEASYRFQAGMRTQVPARLHRQDSRSRRRRGNEDVLDLVVEIKRCRGQDAKEKKSAMDNDWVPGVNRLRSRGRWAFAEFTDMYAMQQDFSGAVEAAFGGIVKDALEHTKKRII